MDAFSTETDLLCIVRDLVRIEKDPIAT